MRTTRLFTAFVIAVGLAVAGAAQAEQSKTFDNYEVHYNAFNSSFLPPEVAEAYDIQRSKYRALLNVAVLEKDEGAKKPVRAVIVGNMKNLLGQVQDLNFTEIREGEAVYYIADFRFTDDEILNFDLEVSPAPSSKAYELNFEQHFYAD